MFHGAASFTGGLDTWDVAKVTNMQVKSSADLLVPTRPATSHSVTCSLTHSYNRSLFHLFIDKWSQTIESFAKRIVRTPHSSLLTYNFY